MLVAVLSGFGMAIIAPVLSRHAPRVAGWLLSLLPLGLFFFFWGRVKAEESIEHYAWIPSLGIELSFNGDGLGLLFALLICGIGYLVTVYSGAYLHDHPLLGRWYAFLLMFMGSMLGVVLSDNVFSLFVFWELTSFTSYLLIGFNNEEAESREAALQALLVTGMGGLAMLAGLILLSEVAGTSNISEMGAATEKIRESGYYLPVLLLILAGAFTKSAQFPFHFWLPNAMAAPTPASAYLHSSTMVKAGVFLLARLNPVLGGTTSWTTIVTTVGAITMLLGAYLAIRQALLKRLLAYSTVSALGLITLLLGLGTPQAASAAMAFLFAHALYKAALFLVAGILDHETGERRVRRLGGLAKAMPVTAAAAAAAALSMAGIPLLFGFVAKELVYESVVQAPALAVLLTAGTVLSGMAFLVVAVCVAYRPFYGARIETPRIPHEAPPALWLGPAILGASSLFFGLFPGFGCGPLLSSAAAAVLGEKPSLHWALWHGFNPALLLSMLTMAGGLALYRYRDALIRMTEALQGMVRFGPERAYGGAMNGLISLAKQQTAILQNGYLRYYLLTIVLTTLLLTFPVLLSERHLVSETFLRHLLESLQSLHLYELGLAFVMVLAIGAAVHSRTRLAAVAALGLTGFGISLIFIFFGAPDLAMTQFVIETLTVILLVLTFYHLPPFSFRTSRPVLLRDLAIALGLGTLMGLLVLVAADSHQYPTIAAYYAENSYAQAHGRNIVNVILVDFRGLDTLGEITVLSVAAIGAYALLKLRLGGRRSR